MRTTRKLLLLSTGGHPLFQHARGELTEFLAGRKLVGVVTAARLTDEVVWFQRAARFFRKIGIDAEHIRWDSDANGDFDFDYLDAIVVIGGNTYALLERLRDSELFDAIDRAVRNGLPYVGASAGANVAGRTILTTNDWNVVGSVVFNAFQFVPWNVNVHYPRRADARSGTRFGETRDERIAEYRRVHWNSVVALEEPAIVHVNGRTATVLGKGRVQWFARGKEPVWFSPGDRLPPIRWR